jgi:hypothetical protein
MGSHRAQSGDPPDSCCPWQMSPSKGVTALGLFHGPFHTPAQTHASSPAHPISKRMGSHQGQGHLCPKHLSASLLQPSSETHPCMEAAAWTESPEQPYARHRGRGEVALTAPAPGTINNRNLSTMPYLVSKPTLQMRKLRQDGGDGRRMCDSSTKTLA